FCSARGYLSIGSLLHAILSNDECLMTNVEGMTNDEIRMTKAISRQRPFVIRISSFIRHSSLDIRYTSFPLQISVFQVGQEHVSWLVRDREFRPGGHDDRLWRHAAGPEDGHFVRPDLDRVAEI